MPWKGDFKRYLDGAEVLVTGGCGMIGSRIVKVLADHGAIVTVLDRLDAYPFDYARRFGSRDVARTVVKGDVCDQRVVESLMRSADFVIHAGAYADIAGSIFSPQRDFESNVIGMQVVLEAARKRRPARLLFVSSSSVYGDRTPTADRPPLFSEEDATAVCSTYANSKLWGEHQTSLYSQLYDLPVTILRYFSVYGPPQIPKERSHSWCVAWFVTRATKGKPLVLHGGGAQVRDFIYVDDVAYATVLALVKPETLNQTINLGTGRATRIADVAKEVSKHFPAVQLVNGPRPKGDPFGGFANIRHMRQLLEWTPGIDLETGITRYIDWVGNNEDLIPDWV
jgi:nucleoside-diphosphate-sugar epimerase